MNNDLINELNNKLEAQDKIINTQALEIARIKEDKKKLKEYIENNKKFNYDENSFECKVLFREMLEILGDKE